MKKYFLTRLLYLLPLLLGITFLSYALMHAVSGDVVDKLYENLGVEATEAVKLQLRAKYGLDQPFLLQYVHWLGRALSGDMGISFVSGQPVFTTMLAKLPNTLLLAGLSLLLTLGISLPLGFLSAWKQNSLLDYSVRLLSYTGNSLPGFFVSLLLILVFSVKLGWVSLLQTGGLSSIILPALTLTIAMAAKYTRQVRATVLEQLHQDYVIGAKARGVPQRVIFRTSILKMILPTLVTLLALSMGSLLGGAVIVEAIFMWDGIGKLAVTAITLRDYPVIQAYVVWMATIYVVVNLGADLLCFALDPRLERRGKLLP